MKKQLWAVLAIALVVIGSAFAVTVNYLSNTTQVTTSVSSPIVMTVSADGETYADTAELGATYGGDEKSIFVKTENKANAAITGARLTLTVDAVSCSEVSANTGTCADDEGNAVFVITNDYTGHETKDQTVVLTFVPNIAPGDYTASAQVLYG